MLPTKFEVNWLFDSGEEAKIKSFKMAAMAPSWISDRNDFSSFLSTIHPDVSCQVWSQLAFRFRRKKFQDCSHGGHLGLRSE